MLKQYISLKSTSHSVVSINTQLKSTRRQIGHSTTQRHTKTTTRRRTTTTATVVHESLTLLPFQSASEDKAAELVDTLWSMQYLVPGPICGSAGKIVPLVGSSNIPPPTSHAVLFRYGQLAVMDTFLGHLKTKEAIRNCATLSGQG